MGRLRDAAGMLALLALCAAVSADTAGDALRAPRRPVAPPAAASGQQAMPSPTSDPVVGRVHSLLAGVPIRRGGIDVVPLFARRPSEASSDDAVAPEWRSSGFVLRPAAPGIVRIQHEGPAAVLLVPGLFVRVGRREYRTLRVDVIAPGRSLLTSVRETLMPVLRPEDSTQGLLPANDVARTLLGDSVPTGTGAVSLRGIRKWPPYAQVARDAAKWFVVPKSSGSDRADRGTCVGCVTLLGGRVLSAHLFGSHTLFRDAWPDILATAMIEQRAAVRAGAPIPQLEQRAARGNPRGRALLVLRTLTAQPGRTREIPGGGLRWEAGGRADGVLAQGLVSASGRVVYVGLYPVPPSVAPPPKPSAPPAEAEEDPKKRRGGRFNPFGGTVPGGVRDPLTPPR